ncbi:MAG: GAF domain-containing protein [Candidatus Solibacter usitatus]|nr:GAF domain-containing protein [Candidatus Solibacter usitatus]
MDEVAGVDFFQRVSKIVSSELTLDEMLGEIVGLAVQVTSCDACLVYLLEKDEGKLVLRASQLPHAADLGTLQLKIGEGVTGWVAENKSVLTLSANAASDSRFKRFGHIIEDTYEAIASVPLMTGGDIVGVINVHHREPHEYTLDEVSMLVFVGEQMGNAVARARLTEVVERLETELETRKVVERAKGILQRNHALTEEEAYLKLKSESRRTRKPMKELAHAIITVEELNRRPEN